MKNINMGKKLYMKLSYSIFITFIFYFSPSALANEYIHKGTYSLSGSASYSQYDPDPGPKTTELQIGPKYLYFISNNISIGGGVNYYQNKFNGAKFESYGVGPLVRYYFDYTNILPFISFEYFYTQFKSSGSNVIGYKDIYRATAVGAGLNYFLTKNVALEAELKRSSININRSQGNNTDAINIGLYIGINVFFN